MPYVTDSETQKLGTWGDEVDLSLDHPGGADEEAFVNCEGSVAIPGVLHILHNCFAGLGDSMQEFATVVESLKQVANLLRQPETKERLLSTCFSDPIGQGLSPDIKAFSGHVYEERWGHVSDCALQMVGCEKALRHMWSLEKYVDPTSQGERHAERKTYSVNLEVADSAIGDPFFWAYVQMLSILAGVQLRLTSWVEGCPCHWDLTQDRLAEVPSELRSLCDTCPLKGMRGSDIASGKFQTILQDLWEINAAQLVMNMPPSISQAERLAIISDFENGRSHVMFQMALKMSHWQTFPWASFGASSQDEEKSKQILEQTLASDCAHPRVQCVKSELLQEQIAEFMEDPQRLFLSPDPVFLKNLREWFAISRLVSVVERRIEGKHAASAKEVKRAPHHSCPYVSLLHRIGEITTAFKQEPDTIKDLAECLLSARSGLAAVKLLNLDQHPTAINGQHCRDPTYVRIVYHADPYVKYCMSQPELPLDKPPSGEDRAVAMDDSGSDSVRQGLAQRHVRAKLHEPGPGGPHQKTFFSVALSSGALKTLKSFLLPEQKGGIVPESAFTGGGFITASCDGGADYGQSWPPTCVESGPSIPSVGQKLVFFKLQDGKNTALARREKVQGEKNLSGCTAVTAHTLVNVDPVKRNMTLSLAPLNFTSASSGQAPLVFNPLQLGLKDLENMRIWTPKTDRQLAFSFAWHYMHSLSVQTRKEVPGLLFKLMNMPGGVCLSKCSTHLQELLTQLFQDEMLVEKETVSESGASMRLVALTAKGTQCVETCVIVEGGQRLCEKPGGTVPPLDMTTYEVVLCLEQKGFRHQIVSKKEIKAIKKEPFVEGSRKTWLTKEGGMTVSHLYLVALLTTSEHGKDVPHFASDTVYKSILGLGPCPEHQQKKNRQPRRAKMMILGESFCPELLLQDEHEAPQQKRRRAAETKGERKATVQAEEEEALEFQDSGVEGSQAGASTVSDLASSDSDSDGSDSDSSSSPWTTPSESDSSSSSSSSKDEAPGHDPAEASASTGAGAGGKASPAETPARHLGTKKRLGKKAKAVDDDIDIDKTKTISTRTRGKFQAEPWDVFKLTYFDRKGSCGYQMTCTNPQHNQSGQALCTKSRSERFEGGADMCLNVEAMGADGGAGCEQGCPPRAMGGSFEVLLRRHCVD